MQNNIASETVSLEQPVAPKVASPEPAPTGAAKTVTLMKVVAVAAEPKPSPTEKIREHLEFGDMGSIAHNLRLITAVAPYLDRVDADHWPLLTLDEAKEKLSTVEGDLKTCRMTTAFSRAFRRLVLNIEGLSADHVAVVAKIMTPAEFDKFFSVESLINEIQRPQLNGVLRAQAESELGPDFRKRLERILTKAYGKLGARAAQFIMAVLVEFIVVVPSRYVYAKDKSDYADSLEGLLEAMLHCLPIRSFVAENGKPSFTVLVKSPS